LPQVARRIPQATAKTRKLLKFYQLHEECRQTSNAALPWQVVRLWSRSPLVVSE
jgi:hypothetical protein